MLIDTIQSAILEKKELLLKIKLEPEGNNEVQVFLQPYVYGEDVLQFKFVWGYLAESDIFYKVFTDSITSAETIEIPYKVSASAAYQQQMYEKSLCVVEGLQVKYVRQDYYLNN